MNKLDLQKITKTGSRTKATGCTTRCSKHSKSSSSSKTMNTISPLRKKWSISRKRPSRLESKRKIHPRASKSEKMKNLIHLVNTKKVLLAKILAKCLTVISSTTLSKTITRAT